MTVLRNALLKRKLRLQAIDEPSGSRIFKRAWGKVPALPVQPLNHLSTLVAFVNHMQGQGQVEGQGQGELHEDCAWLLVPLHSHTLRPACCRRVQI